MKMQSERVSQVNPLTFDGGASIWYGCGPSDYPVPVRAVTTQIGDLSVFLTPYVPTSTSSAPSSSSPEASVSTQATGSSPTDPGSASSVDQSSLLASQSAVSAPSPSASSSPLNGLSIGSAVSAPSASASSSPLNSLSIGSEIGSIVGAIFGGLALIVAIYFGRKQYLRVRSSP
jgi:cobalamin biosynthesis Mg chelatase CobN